MYRIMMLTQIFVCLLLHRTCPKTHPKFKQLVQRVTQNFDTFEDFGDCALEHGHASKYTSEGVKYVLSLTCRRGLLLHLL
jgi:hypothetical protein